MKDNFIQYLYTGILRFAPLGKYFRFRTNQKGNFPTLGFFTPEKKNELEKQLGVSIHSPEYFEQALMHRSYLQVIGSAGQFSNERLEFLGDSVLGMVVAEYLFSLHTEVLEGELTKMRSWLVNKTSLAICARKLQLDSFLMLSYSASRSLEHGSDSILSDALEAIIGAIYLDSGLDTVKKFIIHSLLPIMISKSLMVDTNYKSNLLETVQALGKNAPKYIVHEESGPDHDKSFVVGVYVNDVLLATGTGKSKKQAEQTAAYNALELPEISAHIKHPKSN